jgi:hypothetical protein
MNINWKKVPRMGPSDRHIHEGEFDSTAIAYRKGHYVNRPFLKYSSSKWECVYIDLYDVLFAPLKQKNITLIEYGVYTGESIRYFRDYFLNPDAHIVGFDHHKPEFYGHDWHAKVKGIPNTEDAGEAYDGPTHNVTFFLGDQNSDEDIKNCCEQHGPFDIVVDDASHAVDLTDFTFRRTWPYLKENGFYCIEDIGIQDIKYLLDEITVTKQGRGVLLQPSGFGPGGGGSSVCLVLVKSKYGITGLDEVLVEEPVLSDSYKSDSVV